MYRRPPTPVRLARGPTTYLPSIEWDDPGDRRRRSGRLKSRSGCGFGAREDSAVAVLITGGAGFVGLSIAECLLQRGQDVVIADLTAPPEPARTALSSLGGTLRVVTGDVTDTRLLAALFAEHCPTDVVHGAALTPGTDREGEDPVRLFDVNVVGALRVVEAARRHAVRRTVVLSSASVYGRNAFSDRALDEARTTPAPEALYAISKLAAEQSCLRLRTIHGLDLVVLRLGSVFGPWERDTAVRETLSPMFQVMALALAGEEAVLPRPCRRDWLYGRDLGRAVAAVLAATAPAQVLYNVGPGASYTVAEWCACLAGLLPGFRYRVDVAGANVDLHSARDRAPLAVDRLAGEMSDSTGTGLEASVADYLQWARQHTGQVRPRQGGPESPRRAATRHEEEAP